MFLDHFNMLMSKIIFKKYIILMYFQVKNILKNICLFLCFKSVFFKLNYFFIFSYRFDVLMPEINFKKLKIYYFNTFSNENHFKK